MKNVNKKFFNRELSWIAFNERVMHEAFRDGYPILERFKFLCITSSNFDEFFMVRVAGIKRTILNKALYECPSGISAEALINKISEQAHVLISSQYDHLNKTIMPKLTNSGIDILQLKQLSSTDKKQMKLII